MKSIATYGLVTLLAFGLCGGAAAQEARQPANVTQKKAAPVIKKAPRTVLPAPAQEAFQKAYPNATIKNVSKETENGKTVYEVESVDQGLNRDLIYNPDGSVVEIEEQVKTSDLPPAVIDAVKSMYSKASITKAERLTRGETTQYELALKGAPKSSIELTPEGKPVTPQKPQKATISPKPAKTPVQA